ncbi:MAG: mevalonate kinase [Anaerolineaceae bacterium]|nr:mevalonate kinase [Anaerolineaceae bacterium]
MAHTIQKAPGKIILFGEHAVVYGQPAIAVPIPQRFATVTIEPIIRGDHPTHIIAPDIDLDQHLSDLPDNHPFVLICKLVKDHGNLHHLPAMNIQISSTLPVASGLGSGAAVSVALARALCTFLGVSHSNADISGMAYEVEKIHHGNPSGIDNTVIAFQKGILFQKQHPIQWLSLEHELDFLIVNSGEKKSTKIMVDMVAEQLQNSPERYQSIIEQIGSLTLQAKSDLESADIPELGKAMHQNHLLLQQLGVSTPTLDKLVEIAMKNGAAGAKLSGAGGGGNMLILPNTEKIYSVQNALLHAGFTNIIQVSIH